MPQRLRSGAVMHEQYTTPTKPKTRSKKTLRARERGEEIPEEPLTVRRKCLFIACFGYSLSSAAPRSAKTKAKENSSMYYSIFPLLH
jgi:hypothetical protein